MRDAQVTHYYHLTLEHAAAAVSKFQHGDPNTLSSMVQSFCHLWLETIAKEKNKINNKTICLYKLFNFFETVRYFVTI